MSIVRFPPKQVCPLCNLPLRPATRREIAEDLRDPRRRDIALRAVQGQMDWEPPDEFPEWLKDICQPGSWMLRCDRCDLRSFHTARGPFPDCSYCRKRVIHTHLVRYGNNWACNQCQTIYDDLSGFKES